MTALKSSHTGRFLLGSLNSAAGWKVGITKIPRYLYHSPRERVIKKFGLMRNRAEVDPKAMITSGATRSICWSSQYAQVCASVRVGTRLFGGLHLTILAIKTSALLQPEAETIRSKSWPAGPTKGRPCLSSWAPGPSPMSITLASGLPSPKTTDCAPQRRAHRWQAKTSFCSSSSRCGTLPRSPLPTGWGKDRRYCPASGSGS